jgi:hypothetical protein
VVSPVATTASYTIVPGGAPVTVTVSTSGGTSTASFSGTAGQRISLNMGSVTITSSKISILKPGGTNLVTPFTVTRSGSFFDVHTLPTTGTYKIVVDPKLTYTGRMVLTLYDVPADPASGPVPLDGTLASLTTTVPGQNGTFTFNGTAGQRVSVDVTNVILNGTAKLRILKPDSTLLYPTALSFGGGGGFLEPKDLPVTGLYTAVVDPQLRAVGSADLKFYDTAADTTLGPALTDGTNTNVPTASPGQNAYLTFVTALPNQRMSFLFQNSSYGGLKASVLEPDGTLLFSPSVAVSSLDTFVDTKTLPTAGQYKVFLNPQGADTGNVDVKIYNVGADATGSIPTTGAATTFATGTPGKNALFTFSGNANQRVSLEVVAAGNTYDSAKVSILKPDGSLLFSPALLTAADTGAFHEPVTLPTTSTQYKVKVDPQGPATGQLDVKLWIVPADVTGPLTPSVTKTVTITAVGQNALLTYAGTAGQRISLNLTGVTLGGSNCCSGKIKVTKPDGSTLVLSTTFGTDGKFIDTKSLTLTGTYKISIDPQGSATGNVAVTLYLVTNDATATSPALTSAGVSASVTTISPGQNGKLSFTAAAGQTRFAFKLVSFTGGSCNVKISVQRSDGTNVSGFYPLCATDGDWFDTKALPTVPATYKIFVDPQGTSSGVAQFTLYAVPPDVTGTLTGSANPSLSPGQNARYTFTGAALKTASVTFSSGTISGAWARMYNTNGTSTLNSAFWDPTITNDPVSAVLPTTTPPGSYSFLLDPVGNASGSMSFTLSLS